MSYNAVDHKLGYHIFVISSLAQIQRYINDVKNSSMYRLRRGMLEYEDRLMLYLVNVKLLRQKISWNFHHVHWRINSNMQV